MQYYEIPGFVLSSQDPSRIHLREVSASTMKITSETGTLRYRESGTAVSPKKKISF